MTRTKHYFNLVELVLAIGVAAIGITSILGLLPVALHSTSESVGDTLSADAANTIITLIDEKVKEDFDIVYDTSLIPQYNSKPVRFRWYLSDSKSQDTTVVTLDSDSSYKTIPEDILSNKGEFKFYFGPEGGAADFSAEVRIWRDYDSSNRATYQVTTYNENNTKGLKQPAYTTGSKGSFVRLIIEISWPLARRYVFSGKDENGKSTYIYPRNSRIFIREYFDPRFSN